jgi:hypothetical protein
MIDVLDDPPGDDLRELLEVEYVAGGWIDLAGHDDLQHVVVPVEIRALAEYPVILFIGQSRVVQLMRRVERLAAADEHGR